MILRDYQSLIGSFLGVIFAIGFWYLKSYVEKRRELESNKKEIENIFFMAARESEDAFKDLKIFISEVKEGMKRPNSKMDVFSHSKFNRVYINETRLFFLKKDLGFIISQQIDIAVSSAKKFNSYLDSAEQMPQLIFDNAIKMLHSGLMSEQEVIKDYEMSRDKFFKNTGSLLGDMEVMQRHLLRPMAALTHPNVNLKKFFKKRELNRIPNFDEIFDQEASVILQAIKIDLAKDIVENPH